MSGERQIVFVTGEPGIGKTTVVDAFLFGVRSFKEFGVRSTPPQTPNPELSSTPILIARGQCLEQYGEGEAYLPVMEVLGQLCRGPGGERVLAVLQRYAPTWLVQMPALVQEAELEALQRKAAGATRERMLREIAEALEALTTEQGTVLVFEDLHWSDRSTVELLAYLAQRRTVLRLLVVGTYRLADIILRDHPLKGIKQELQGHGQCEEIRLELLTTEEVQQYVTQQLGAQTSASELAEQVYHRTDGNPLFMCNVVEQYLHQGRLDETAPASVQEMIGRQIARLSEEQRQMLEAGSVMGIEFVVAVVADVLQGEVETLEAHCEELAQAGRFLQEAGIVEWPDGTLSGRYRFRHALYQEVLYQRIVAVRRVRLHRQIGLREEVAYGKRAREIAAELAMHFERGRDYQRAVQYLTYAGKNASQRSAHTQATAQFSRALELLATLPDTTERSRQELALVVALGSSLIAIKGYGAPEVEQVYLRAHKLCQHLQDAPQLFSVLGGLGTVYYSRTQFRTALDLSEQMLAIAHREQDPRRLIWAHFSLAINLADSGEVVAAREHLEQGLSYYEPQKHRVQSYVQDPAISCLRALTYVLWLLGYPNQARQRSQEALALAQTLSHAYNTAMALDAAYDLHHRCRELRMAQDVGQSLLALAHEHGFPFFVMQQTVRQGWEMVMQGHGPEGITQIRQDFVRVKATEAEINLTFLFALLADAYRETGQREEGLQIVEEALAMSREGPRWRETELYRLKGELLLAQVSTEHGARSTEQKIKSQEQGVRSKEQKSGNLDSQSQILDPESESEAETCFLKALDLARQQQAKSLELRAVMSLVRLRQQQSAQQRAKSKEQGAGRKKSGVKSQEQESLTQLTEAHKMLVEVYEWFTEGFETQDLQDARALLEELRR